MPRKKRKPRQNIHTVYSPSSSSSDQDTPVRKAVKMSTPPPTTPHTGQLQNVCQPAMYGLPNYQLMQTGLPQNMPQPQLDMNMMMSSIQQQLGKLEKLDLIENKLTVVEQQVSEIKSLKETVLELRDCLNYMGTELHDVKTKLTEAEKEIKVLKKENSETSSTTAKLSEDMLDVRRRSMRDNLFFFRIEEKKASKDYKVHRMGKAKFSHYLQREKVKQAAFNLRDIINGGMILCCAFGFSSSVIYMFDLYTNDCLHIQDVTLFQQLDSSLDKKI